MEDSVKPQSPNFIWKPFRSSMPFPIVILILLIIIYISRFGWKYQKTQELSLSGQEQELAGEMETIVSYLAEDIGNRNFRDYEHMVQTVDYIINYFISIGYEVVMHEYAVKGVPFKNIIAQKGAYSPKDATLYFGAHYDTCFNPGADDNASGIAGLLTLAKLLKDEQLAIPVRYVAFVNEEPPFFMSEHMGSRQFTKFLKNDGAKVRGAIILEMIGYYSDEAFSQSYFPLLGPFYPNQGNFIAAIGNFSSRGLLQKLKKAYQDHAQGVPMETLTVPSFLPGSNFSDHWSFWQEGYPALMITDTAYMRNSNYHKDSDRYNTLDYQKMAAMILGLKQAILNMIGGQKK